MGRGRRGEPPLEGRSFLPVDDFCRATGLDRASVQELLTTGGLDGLFDGAGRAVGLWDDVLPTAGRLREMGLQVSDDYLPDALRSTAQDDDDEGDQDGGDDSGPTWTLTWGPELSGPAG